MAEFYAHPPSLAPANPCPPSLRMSYALAQTKNIKNLSKNPCQAPKPPNRFLTSNIQLPINSSPLATIEVRPINKKAPESGAFLCPNRHPGSGPKSKRMSIYAKKGEGVAVRLVPQTATQRVVTSYLESCHGRIIPHSGP